MEIVLAVLAFIVALGPLIVFHEYGHFWVARRLGVKVERFSIGFGNALWKRTARDGVEYRLASLPLGGYVKMLDEREGPVDPADRHRAFNRQSLAGRSAIVAAGPAFNLILAIAAFWLMFVIGIPGSLPVLDTSEGLAEQAGLERGDRIVRVGHESTQTWTHAIVALVGYGLDREEVSLDVVDESGFQRTLTLPLDQLDGFDEEQPLASIGMYPWQPLREPVVGQVQENSPAESAGLRGGDRILSIDGQPLQRWQDIGRIMSGVPVNASVAVDIDRGGQRLQLMVTPETSDDNRRVLGVYPQPLTDTQVEEARNRLATIQSFGPVAAVPAAFGETWRLTRATVEMLGRMITGRASVKNLSGPITIARFARDSARSGLGRFLFFIGLVSLSLAVLNLLPVPMLDGGQLLVMGIEAVRGKPLSEHAQIVGQSIGLLALVGLMSLALVNDILRLVN